MIQASSNSLSAAPNIVIRDACSEDFPAVLALNLAFEHFLSPMLAPRLALLHSQASYHRVVTVDSTVAAFLMAHRKGTGYDSDNYAWFSSRYAEFVYIDRVVVSATAQGLGLGRRLYEDLFQWAAEQRLPCVVLEFDSEPPNAVSERFHSKMGFTHVGFHTSANTGKRVNMQHKPV
jgi:predicted GNAT superfamily acetyltransferase